MIGVDFREPNTLERLQRLFAETIGRSREVRASLLLAGGFLVLLGIESVRLIGVVHNVRDLAHRRDLAAARINAMQTHVRSIEERRTALATALKLRNSNRMLATRIAMLTDLLAPTIALTSFRGLPSGIDVEGRGLDLDDVRASLQRLQLRLGAPATFEVRREEGMSGVVWFRLSISAK